MPCYRPIIAYRSRAGRDPRTGKWPIVFKLQDGYQDLTVTVPCGQCIGCRLERSRQWAIRCLHESSLYEHNCFITLTYSDDNLPSDGSLNKRDIQLFFKRLRKRFGEGIRYFQCGEYGSLFSRPHHHACVFNFDFPDKVLWSVCDGVKLYRSAILEELWPHGYSTIGDVTFESAAYVARYILKKITGDSANAHYDGRLPEFVTMSRRPGIGYQWYQLHKDTIYDNDAVFVRPGVVAKPPKYYDRIYDLTNPDSFCKIKARRRRAAQEGPDNTFERLTVRERVQVLKAKKLIRPLENLEVNSCV